MIAFLMMCYCGIIWLIFFKLKLLPWNKVSQFISVIIGFLSIMELLILINIYQPYSTQATVIQKAIPIVSRVAGRVLEVPIKPNTLLNKGDVLFTIDPRPYQYQVDQLKARLKLARTRLKQSEELAAHEAGSVYESEQYAAEVDQLIAQLENAELNLSETTLYAPADGFVTQLFLRPGAVTLTAPFSSVMNFTYADSLNIAVPFRQNSLRHVKKGNPVQIAFDTQPGKIFKGRVVDIVPATGGAVLSPSGTLLQSNQIASGGPIWARIQVDDDVSNFLLPAGTSGAVAIYTDKGEALSIIRKIIIRFYTWLNYL